MRDVRSSVAMAVICRVTEHITRQYVGGPGSGLPAPLVSDNPEGEWMLTDEPEYSCAICGRELAEDNLLACLHEVDDDDYRFII